MKNSVFYRLKKTIFLIEKLRLFIEKLSISNDCTFGLSYPFTPTPTEKINNKKCLIIKYRFTNFTFSIYCQRGTEDILPHDKRSNPQEMNFDFRLDIEEYSCFPFLISTSPLCWSFSKIMWWGCAATLTPTLFKTDPLSYFLHIALNDLHFQRLQLFLLFCLCLLFCSYFCLFCCCYCFLFVCLFIVFCFCFVFVFLIVFIFVVFYFVLLCCLFFVVVLFFCFVLFLFLFFL